jgi:moderate conductance mechanosensitive channel
MADRSLPRLQSTLKPAEPEPIISVVSERGTLELNFALRAAVFLLAALLIAVWAPTSAITAGAPSFAPKPSKGSHETASPAEVQALLNLIADPKVQAWLAEHGKTETAPSPPDPALESPAEMISTDVEAVREHIAEMAAAVPSIPAQFTHATDVPELAIGGHRAIRILSLVAAFVALGYGTEALFWYATRRMRRDIETHSVDTVGDRVSLVGERAAFALASVAAYAVGGIGAFLLVHWPGLLRHIVLSYLIVFLAVRMAGVLGRFLLAPHNERFRVIPTDAVTARYWHLRLRLIIGWLVFALVFRELEETLGISPGGINTVGGIFGLSWIAILMESLWRRPFVGANETAPEAARETRWSRRVKLNSLLTLGLVFLWGLRAAGMMPAFWLVAVVIAWPLAHRLTQSAVEHLLRPPGTAEFPTAPSLTAVFLERGLRAALVIGGLAILAWGWGIDIQSLTVRETMLNWLTGGAFSAVAIVLIADLVWQVAKAAIDTKFALTADLGSPNTDEARRRARVRTLLPIIRNILFVIVIVVAVMMALAAFGVDIGPLIAGASVIGVAVGFGAQTFVRDVIAGMFYMLDDAFRVGEYIQSGNYKGTVEGFSIRSVRLRHQRGPVFTVPFSLLGAVENMSRDWVIDKMTLNVTYDTDLDLARKLIKQVGHELVAEPEFASLIIEPLKMQGIDAFGDFAIQLRAKMMTLPGEQFVVRRAAFARIKKAFDANGVKFAFPTVQLAGKTEPRSAAATASVAREALALVHAQVA